MARKVLEREGVASPDYVRYGRNTNRVLRLTVGIVVALVMRMVFKPNPDCWVSLWGG